LETVIKRLLNRSKSIINQTNIAMNQEQKSPRLKKTDKTTISFAVKPSEKEQILQKAGKLGVGLSEFLRIRALIDKNRADQIVQKNRQLIEQNQILQAGDGFEFDELDSFMISFKISKLQLDEIFSRYFGKTRFSYSTEDLLSIRQRFWDVIFYSLVQKNESGGYIIEDYKNLDKILPLNRY